MYAKQHLLSPRKGIFSVAATMFCALLGLAQTAPTREIEPFFDLSFSPEERDSLFQNLKANQSSYNRLHANTTSNNILARAYQEATTWDEAVPPLFK